MNDEIIKSEFPFERLNFDNNVLVDCKDIEIISNGNHVELWMYFMNKYSKRTPIGVYQIEQYFKTAVEILFKANNFKYTRLLNTQIDYDVLSPYHIKEEHVTGSKVGNTTTTPNITNETTSKETSFDDLNPKVASVDTSVSSGSTTTEVNHNISETFEADNKELTNLANSEKRFDSRTGNIGNHANSDLISKERTVANFVLWDIVCKDIVDYTCYKFIV